MRDDRSDHREVKRRGVGWKIASLLLIYLLLVTMFNVAWRLLHIPPQMQRGVVSPSLMLLSGMILLGAILVASISTLHYFDSRPLSTVGVPFSGPWVRQNLIGLLCGSIPPILFVAVAYKLGCARAERLPLDLHHLLSQTLPALGSYLLLAYHEELLFRGYLLQLISQKSARVVAAVITGLLFGLLHGGNPAANPQGLIFTAISGVMLAWLVMRNGSLWMAGGYHVGWNATASLVLGLNVSGIRMPGSWIATSLTGPRWISGGAYGFESSIITGLLEPLILGSLIWIAPRLPSNPELRRYFQKASSG
jgi:uncharacterized protein